MALTNFVVTVAAVGAVILLARTDIRKSAAIFRRNVRHVRNWLEEESTAASKYVSLLNSMGLILFIPLISVVIGRAVAFLNAVAILFIFLVGVRGGCWKFVPKSEQ